MNKILFIAFMATLAFADVGKVTVVKGDATVQRDFELIQARNDMGLMKQDVVETAQGRLQMYFNDKTVISLGRESRFVIKEYLYTEGSQQVAATFRIEKGFIKTITGAIGKIMPELFVLETSVTKITPHGTIWSVEVNDESEVYKVLEGRITLSFNDGLERKIELNAGETASLQKSEKGTVKSFQRAKISDNPVNSRYENRLEQYAATVSEERAIDRVFSTAHDDNGHGNDEDGFDESNPGEGNNERIK